MAKDWMTPAEFLAAHQGMIGRSALYEALRTGAIPSVRVGKKYLIPSDAFGRLLERHPTPTSR